MRVFCLFSTVMGIADSIIHYAHNFGSKGDLTTTRLYLMRPCRTIVVFCLYADTRPSENTVRGRVNCAIVYLLRTPLLFSFSERGFFRGDDRGDRVQVLCNSLERRLSVVIQR